MLKMVDCAIAVCAATTNKSATNSPEKTLVLFTVLTRLSFSQQKTPSRTPWSTTGRRRLQFFCHTAMCGGLEQNKNVQPDPIWCRTGRRRLQYFCRTAVCDPTKL